MNYFNMPCFIKNKIRVMAIKIKSLPTLVITVSKHT